MNLSKRISAAFSVLLGRTPKRPPIEASYDLARMGNEIVNLWGNRDALDADAANSLAVRKKFRESARYERANSGQCSGIIGTQANYVVGKGPKLRMQTGSAPFNAMIEARWKKWAKTIGLARKLRTLSQAKTTDGESIAIIQQNPWVNDLVKLDVRTTECDRLTSPVGQVDDRLYVDGIRFDEYGNPITYDILERHPGAAWFQNPTIEYKTYSAAYVCHWFDEKRSEQHRGLCDLGPSMNTFGTGRRWREAVVASAETAADFSAVVNMGMASEGNDEVTPFTTLPIEKRMLIATPAGATISQLKAEQPTSTYDILNNALIAEAARPIHMPRNIAACDSSGYSFSGGQLDHQTYFVSVEVAQQDCEEMVLEKVFKAWFEAAVLAYGWTVPAFPAPDHAWAWPGRPKIDPEKTANARMTNLSTGVVSPSGLLAEDGEDWEDHLVKLAEDYGVTPEEMQQKLLESNFQKSGGAPGSPNDQSSDNQSSDDPPAQANRIGHLIHGNGNGSHK